MLSGGQDIVRLLAGSSARSQISAIKPSWTIGIHVITGLPACNKVACLMKSLFNLLELTRLIASGCTLEVFEQANQRL
ncbi:hypothetical protein BZP36_14460 [Raoultella terrigena]|nr:hypothetical protein BZP36_14460 [Raoultella terrigena]